MKKTILYILILVVLGLGVWFAFFKETTNPFGNSDAGFTVTDTAAIGKIFLAHTDGHTITLERKSGGWIMDGKYPVLTSTINGLLATLHNQRAEAPVAKAARNNVIKEMATSSVKTEVYNRDGRQMAVFFVGGENSRTGGTFMLMDGAQTPYVVNVPGFNGYLMAYYPVEWTAWRDRHVFNLKPEEIKSVSVTYPEKPVNSFTISQENGTVAATVDSAFRHMGSFNEARAKAYLGFFHDMYSEGFMNGVPHMDSILAMLPVRCVVTVQPKQGPAQVLTVYWRPLDKRSKNQLTPLPNAPENYDADRFYGVINQDTVTIQRFVFDKVFRSGYEFYSNDVPQPAEQPHRFSAPGTK
jgi:hypothetical protein